MSVGLDLLVPDSPVSGTVLQSRESCDFKTTTMADITETPIDSGQTFFDFSVNTDQIGMGFEADSPEK